MNGFTSLFGEPEGIIISQLIWATQYTIYLSAIAFLGGGLLGSLITLSRILPIRFQSLPLLMLLFLLGLGIPKLYGQDIDHWIAASVALILFTSAYLAEVWRGAITAIPQSQWEAAEALNLNFFQTLRLVI